MRLIEGEIIVLVLVGVVVLAFVGYLSVDTIMDRRRKKHLENLGKR